MPYDDKQVLSMWDESVKQHENGHSEVPIPFKHDPPYLPCNKELTDQQLRYLKRRLVRDPDLHMSYTTYMKELEEKGFRKEDTFSEVIDTSGIVWYLLHHPVFNPRKPNKVRIVFACAVR